MKRHTDEGQAILELAILLPVMTLFIMTALQIALLAYAYLGVTNATREGVRWIAIHPNTTDAVATTSIKAALPPNIDPAKLTVVFTPACPTLTGGKCTGRGTGAQLSVNLSYNASSLALFPGLYTPTLSPSYTMYMRAEPN